MNRKEEVLIKEARLRDLMAKLGLKGVLLKKQSNFSWITGGGINMVPVITELGFTSILITEKEKFLIADRIESARSMNEEGLRDLGYVLLEHEWFESKEYDFVKKIVPGLEVGCDISIYGLRNIEPEIKNLRYSLTPAEIERYLWLGEKTSKAIESVLLDLKPGQTEAEVTGNLAQLLWKDRIDPVGYQAAADDRAYKYRHPIPKENKIEKYLMLCVMARKWGLITTITRIAHFGEVPEKLIKQHRDNVFIECAMIAATQPGVVTKEIFIKARDLYEELGYKDEWKLHHQGGAMGYDVRDYICNSESEEVVQENQVFCWNPSISGTKSEDAFIAQKDGFKFITSPVLFPTIEIKVGDMVFVRPGILEK
ncbi:MAG: M24 family metallopeptidase [Atribacterota bacterium]|nr:M24 family metallopeptidase [Atribacterota bacterium]HHY00048.1 M24 family metallopeptidase [Methanothermobacter sp.]